MRATPTVVAGGTDADFLTVRHLRLSGTHREIGRQLAEAAAAVHGTAAAPRPVDPGVESARRQWFAHHHPAHAERILGVADHLGVDRGDHTVALDWLGTYDLPAGCSVAFYPGETTKDGRGVLSRNFDFPTATYTQIVGLRPIPGERPLAADPWVVELHPDGGYASVTVAIMDALGAMDGVNETGLAVALLADNETPDAEPTGGPAVGLAEQQVVRYLLDTCATVEEAEHALRMAKHYYAFVPCHFVVADRSGRSFVWEHSPRRNHEVVVRAEPGRPLVCTNHLLHRWPDPSLLPSDDGPIGTAALTYARWRTLTSASTSGALLDRDAIRDQFEAIRFTAPVQQARTFWHALYDVDDASMEVSFHLHDIAGESRYTDPLQFAAG